MTDYHKSKPRPSLHHTTGSPLPARKPSIRKSSSRPESARRATGQNMTEHAALPALPTELPFGILHRSNQAVIINKPAGLPVHPGPGTTTSVEDFFPLLSRRKDGPWLAHRLDTDTAGCLAIALRKQTLIAMQAAFATGEVTKTYWAVVEGVPAPEGRITTPLLRKSTPEGWKMIADPKGQTADTQWRRLGTDGRISWLELTLHTGRTHQARIHCALLGTPVLGDPVYGHGTKRTPLHLLSRALTLPLDPPISAIAPPPPSMRAALQRCGWLDDAADGGG